MDLEFRVYLHVLLNLAIRLNKGKSNFRKRHRPTHSDIIVRKIIIIYLIIHTVITHI